MKKITTKSGLKYTLDIDEFYVEGDFRYLVVAKVADLIETLPNMSQGVVAYAEFSIENKKSLVPEHTEVLELYRRLGIASKMYDYIEEKTGLRVRASRLQSEDAENFWKTRKRRS